MILGGTLFAYVTETYDQPAVGGIACHVAVTEEAGWGGLCSRPGAPFVVAGHTDGAGGEGYNQELSERRADSIKRYLTEKFGIAGTDLVTVGYGKSKPKDTKDPMDPANRRVQVVNMANKATASK